MKENNEKFEKLSNAYEDVLKREGQLIDEKNNLQAALSELKENLSEARKEVQKSNAKES